MNVLLINPPLYGVQAEPRFPLGLGYIASTLLDEGHTVRVVDANIVSMAEIQIEGLIKEIPFDIVGLTGLITQFKQVQMMASIVRKNSRVRLLLGGGLASAAPEVVLKKTDVDIVVIGEGERTISELLRSIEDGAVLGGINGICFKENGEIVRTQTRQPIADISSLPLPAWDHFPIERYFDNSTMCMPDRKISIITSRGCPYHCTFCFHGIFGHRYRARSAENVFQEIALLVENYNVRGFMFEDDTFVLNKERVFRLCDLIMKHKLNIYWTCNARVDLMDEQLANQMKRAGCVGISLGIESGNQGQLDRIKKGIKIEEAYKVVDMIKKFGIMAHGFMMVGIPGDTIDTINDSVRFCRKAGLMAEFTIFTPIPGSKVYQDEVETKLMKLKSDDIVEKWGSWLNEVLVNFTNLSNEKLIELKRKAEKEIFNSYYKKNIKYIIKILFLELKINGFFAVLNRLKRGMKVFVRAKKGLNLRET